MKLLLLVIASLLSLSALGEEADTSRSDNIKRFNEGQRCHKSAIAERNKEEALRCAQSSLEAGKSLFEPGSKNIAALTYNYGIALRSTDELSWVVNKEIKNVFTEALTLYESLYGENSVDLVDLLIDLGNAENKVKRTGMNDPVKSSSYKRALGILSSNYGDDSLEYAQAQLAISMEVLEGSHTVNAHVFSNKYAKGAYKIISRKLGPTSVGATLASFQLGKNQMAKQKFSKAIPFLENSLSNPSVAQYAHGFLIEAFEQIGQRDSATFHAQALGKLNQGRQNQNYLPVYRKPPIYPRGAQRSGTNGYVIIEVTVSRDGLAIDPIVIEEMPTSKGFGKAALKASSTLRYVPQFVDGEAVEVPGVLYKYTFQMAR
ncbi:MAG: TonB family protein [SAR92 clade bacterium]|nr:TonB family protein [SAR92 clade bacterium]